MRENSRMEHRERPRTSPAVYLALLVVVLVVASVIGTLAATGRGGASVGGMPGVLGDPVRISTLKTARLYCPLGAAFSPDGSRFAVVGSLIDCHDSSAPTGHFNAHALAIYDAQSGNMLRAISLDPLIGVDPLAPASQQDVQAVRYVGLGWSPDGAHYALAFAAFDSAYRFLPADMLNTGLSGLLLVNVNTGGGTVLRGESGFFASITGTYSGMPIWNVARGSAVAPVAPPPGLAYAWTPKGQVEPILPLTPAALRQLPIGAGPRYPVGNPDGDATYTIWQSGQLMGRDVASTGHHDDAFVSVYPSWSQNGAYVTLMVTGVELPAPASMAASEGEGANPTLAPSTYLRPATLTQVPARDGALAAVQEQIGTAGWAMVAWSPTGSLMASVNCVDAQREVLEVRDTATGDVVGSTPLRLTGSDPGCRGVQSGEYVGDYPNPNLSLLWSPDGRHVLVSDQTAANITVWSLDRVG